MNRFSLEGFTCPRARRALALWLAAGSLAGCQMRGDVRPLSSELPPPPVFAAAPAECRATEARFALGRQIDASLLEEMRARTGARMARTTLPTEAPSGAPDATRLTVDIEANGRVIGARCG